MGEGEESVMEALAQLQRLCRNPREPGWLRRFEELLCRRVQVVEKGELDFMELKLGKVVVPRNRFRFDLYPLDLLTEGVEETERSPLEVKAVGHLIMFMGDWEMFALLDRGAISLRDLLRLAVLERLNPGLLDRIVGAAREVEREQAELLRRLRGAAAIIDMVLR